MRCTYMLLTFAALIFLGQNASGQNTVFGLFKRDVTLGDEYFREKNYLGALELYQNVVRKKPSGELQLRIARCYSALKEYHEVIDHYNVYLENDQNLPEADLFDYAEALAITGNYDLAIEQYREYLARVPDDELVFKKIWRLSNIQYLYEDSAHFAVRPVSFNTELGELCATFYRNQLIFMSNRKKPQLVERVNASLDAPFYKIYSADMVIDTSLSNNLRYDKISPFDFVSSLNTGPIAFYHNDQKMAFISSAKNPSINGGRVLQLYFSEMKDGKWNVPEPFPHNSAQYSIHDVTVSKDGKILYFSSDMEGGLGGKDIYKSVFINGEWSEPENLGEAINTFRDEAFPFLHQERMLYFSSNGHAGLGGMDIFYAAILGDGFSEPENMGYPVNSSYDDFGIMTDSLGSKGYFTSNRKKGGYDDDIYEFSMDLQTYPVTIKGVVKYKEHHLNKMSEAKILANARIFLIDNHRNTTVFEGESDAKGNFSIVVPYFSTYIVRVVGDDGEENDVVLEIPKFRNQVSDHEIVIVKDVF